MPLLILEQPGHDRLPNNDSIVGQPVKLWGTCPAEVELHEASNFFPAVSVHGASGTELSSTMNCA